MTNEIAAGSEQQQTGIDQITAAMEQMNQLTQQNAANSEESASAAEELYGQSEELRTMLAQFRLSNAGRATRTTTGARTAPPAGHPAKTPTFRVVQGTGGHGTGGRTNQEDVIPFNDAGDQAVLGAF